MRIIDKVLIEAINRKASDIHVTNGIKPMLRIDGVLGAIEEMKINDDQSLSQMVKELLSEKENELYEECRSIDKSMKFQDTRFRVHIYKQKELDSMALRLIPDTIPTLEEMNLPAVIKELTKIRNGLVIVSGVTGSGKSTTLAAMINEINTNYAKNIITIEQPIEFVHQHKESIVNQREVGVDVDSFSNATIDAMRADPDILLLGEMRDLETMRNAITMAETGHLVLATLHTKSAAETIDRIIDVFPANQQEQIRIQLSNSIAGIVAQELFPKKGGGRVAVCEVLIATSAIKNLIRTKGHVNEITDHISMNAKKLGSQTREQAIARLIVEQQVSTEEIRNFLTKDEIMSINSILDSKSNQ